MRDTALPRVTLCVLRVNIEAGSIIYIQHCCKIKFNDLGTFEFYIAVMMIMSLEAR